MSALMNQAARPPYVIFATRTKEDRTATLQKGHYVSTGYDVAIVRQAGNKDSIEVEVGEWFTRISKIPDYAPWLDGFRTAYELWKKGQTAPLEGTAIKDWGVLSPEIRELLLGLTIHTVEDLAVANEATLQRIGIGAREWKLKAMAWLEAANDLGSVSQEVVNLRELVREQSVQLAAVRSELAVMNMQARASNPPPVRPPATEPDAFA